MVNENNTESWHNSNVEDVSSGVGINGNTFTFVVFSILKRPWILILSLLVVSVPLWFYLSNINTIYRSQALIMVSVRGSSVLDAMSLVADARYRQNIKTENYYTSILESWAYKDEIAKAILQGHPEMPPDSVKRIVNQSIRYTKNPSEEGFLVIYANSLDKEFAYFMAKTALDKYQERLINLEKMEAEDIRDFIDIQIEHIRDNLRDAEESLQNFLTTKSILISDVEAGITRELSDLERGHNEARARLDLVNSNIESYQKQMSLLLDNIGTDNRISRDKDILKLKERLEEIRITLYNADKQKLTEKQVYQLNEERTQVRNQLVSAVITSASSKDGDFANISLTMQKLQTEVEANLLERTKYENEAGFYKHQIDQFRRDHPHLSEDILTFASLSRNKEVLEKTLDILLEKREEIRIRIASEGGGIKVIDEPLIPDRPLSRKTRQILLFGILVGLTLGLVISVLVERFDNTIKDENDIRQNFGLTVFGTIPSLDKTFVGDDPSQRLKSEAKSSHSRQSTADASKLIYNFSRRSSIAEAYRSLKIAIQFVANDQNRKVIVISSPSSSEGKSLTTGNLGVSFAQGGSKTLIVDCDLRRSIQHKYFQQPRKPGLTDYLYGDVKLDEIIQETSASKLHLVTGGRSPFNPAELLASKKMQEFIILMREKYDFILLDTPPLLACADPRILAEFADGMILIAKVDSTNIKAFHHAVNLNKHLNIEVLGVVLNQIDLKFARTYYYAYRYYKPYSYYSGYHYQNDKYYVNNDDVTDEPGEDDSIQKY